MYEGSKMFVFLRKIYIYIYVFVYMDFMFHIV